MGILRDEEGEWEYPSELDLLLFPLNIVLRLDGLYIYGMKYLPQMVPLDVREKWRYKDHLFITCSILGGLSFAILAGKGPFLPKVSFTVSNLSL